MKIFKAFFPRPVPGFWDLVVGKYCFILGRQSGFPMEPQEEAIFFPQDF